MNEVKTAKYAVGQTLKVVESGWGLHPKFVGQTVVVIEVKNHSGDGEFWYIVQLENRNTKRAAEKSFEPVDEVPPAPPVVMIDSASVDRSQFTTLQALAHTTFSNMLAFAKAIHNEAERPVINTTDGFDYHCGICGNVGDMTPAGTSYELREAMTHVKNNLIARVPTYTGSNSYPVPCPNGGSPESAFDHADNKWTGQYGMNRIVQLEHIVHLIETAWEDELAARITPVRRNGWKVGDLFTSTQASGVWAFSRDDGSASPEFRNLATQNTTYLDMSCVTKFNPEGEEQKSVSEWLNIIETADTELSEIHKAITELKEKLANVKVEKENATVMLALQHKVRPL